MYSIDKVFYKLFSNKIDYDLFDDTLFHFQSCVFKYPSVAFFNQLPLLVALQTFVSALLAYPLYRLNVEPTITKNEIPLILLSRTMFTFCFALPLTFYEPIYIIQTLDIHHIGLRMVLMTLPINGGLRILESYFGFTSNLCSKHFSNYFAYFCCPFILKFDEKTEEPARATTKYILEKLKTIGLYFIYTGCLMSILWHYDWEFFEVGSKVDSFDHSFYELVSWRHLINNYLVALTLSLGLQQSTCGVSLLFTFAFGYQTEDVVLSPMFKSTSVSDFWSRRWNVSVHKGLKNGAYKPMRKLTNSRIMGALSAFIVSGMIHEYVNLVLFDSIEYKSKQVMFFLWNACLIVLEYFLGSLESVQIIVTKIPKPLITALVLCSALPVAHLFTGDWIVHGYFDAVMYAETTILCRSP